MSEYDLIEIGIDIGSSKTVAVVSQKDVSTGRLLVLGVGKYPNNTGVKQGKILDFTSTVLSIQKSIEQAMLISGFQFASANVNIPGFIDSMNSTGIVTIARKDREVLPKDVARVIKQSELVNLPPDKTILHLFPQIFTLDEQDNIKDPVGMNGLRLMGKTHLVTVPQISITNVVKCLERAGIAPMDVMSSGYASSLAVLTPEDKEAGVLFMDIGAGLTDIVGFTAGYPIFSNTVLLGGDSITRDISIGLKVMDSVAETLKCESGVAFMNMVDPVIQIDVPGIRPGEIKRVSLQDMTGIIQSRAEEILSLVKQSLDARDISLSNFTSIVLTGGSSYLKGLPELVEYLFKLPTRVGQPRNLGGLSEKVDSPIYSTVIGLCMGDNLDLSSMRDSGLKSQKNSGVLGKMKNFIKDILG